STAVEREMEPEPRRAPVHCSPSGSPWARRLAGRTRQPSMPRRTGRRKAESGSSSSWLNPLEGKPCDNEGNFDLFAPARIEAQHFGRLVRHRARSRRRLESDLRLRRALFLGQIGARAVEPQHELGGGVDEDGERGEGNGQALAL